MPQCCAAISTDPRNARPAPSNHRRNKVSYDHSPNHWKCNCLNGGKTSFCKRVTCNAERGRRGYRSSPLLDILRRHHRVLPSVPCAGSLHRTNRFQTDARGFSGCDNAPHKMANAEFTWKSFWCPLQPRRNSWIGRRSAQIPRCLAACR